MDLGKCPKCGAIWFVGAERCGTCAFVPIGAGLSKLPKKKKKIVAPYREGGSWAPFFLVAIVGMAGFYAYDRRPWENGFEEFRVLVLGQEPELRMKGDWTITKYVSLDPRTKAPITNGDLTKGKIAFRDDGRMNVDLLQGEDLWKADGRYEQKALSMRWSDLKAQPPTPLQNPLDVGLSDVGGGTVIARVGGDAMIYLKRDGGSDAMKHALVFKMLGGTLKKTGGGE